MAANLISQTVLIFFVVDASRLCGKLIEHLTQLPERTSQLFEERFGLDRKLSQAPTKAVGDCKEHISPF